MEFRIICRTLSPLVTPLCRRALANLFTRLLNSTQLISFRNPLVGAISTRATSSGQLVALATSIREIFISSYQKFLPKLIIRSILPELVKSYQLLDTRSIKEMSGLQLLPLIIQMGFCLIVIDLQRLHEGHLFQYCC